MRNNPTGDFVNIINAYIKFGEILSICSHDIGQKRKSDISQEPQLCYKCAKSDV